MISFLIVIIWVTSLFSFYLQRTTISIILWQFCFFIYIILSMLTSPERFLNFGDVSVSIVWSMITLMCMCEAVILLILVWKEKFIRSILASISYTSIAIVLVLVLFIASEGVPAFIENDPEIFFLTDTWLPNYRPDQNFDQTFTLVPTTYSFEIMPSERKHVCLPDSESWLNVSILNTGLFENTIDLSSISEGISSSLDQNTVTLDAGEQLVVHLMLRSFFEGQYTITLVGVDASTNRVEEEINVNVNEAACNLYPERIVEKFNDFTSSNFRSPLTIKNLGAVGTNITIKIESPSYFRSEANGIQWNRTTFQGTVYIDAQDQLTFNFTTVMIRGVVGNHTHLVWVYDEDGDLLDKTEIITILGNSDLTDNEDDEIISVCNGIRSYHWLYVKNSGQKFSLAIDDIPDGITLTVFVNGTEEYDIGSSPLLYGFDNSTAWVLLAIDVDSEFQGEDMLTLSLTIPGLKQQFGILGFLAGTFLTTLIAIVIAVPLALGSSILLVEYLPRRINNFLIPVFELLAGIPSVVYGLWGIFSLGPILNESVYPLIIGSIGQYVPFFDGSGTSSANILTASIVLAVMILPIILSLSHDAITAVPRELKESSIALGSSKWQMIIHVLLKNARSGIMAAIVLGLGRAVGETMAVLMVMGAAFKIPTSVFDSASTMTTIIATQFGEYSHIATSRHVLFAIALILLVIMLILNVIIYKMNAENNSNKNRSIFLFNRLKKPFNGICNGIHNLRKEKESTAALRYQFKPSWKLKAKETIAKSGIYISGIIVIAFVLYIVGDIIVRGGMSIKLDYYTLPETGGGLGGGFLNAVLGSLSLVGIALAFALPISIGSAIYIQEYTTKESRLRGWTHYAFTTLSSTPSIVFGVFGFMFLILIMDFGTSMLSGGITLAMMIMPLIFISASETLKSVPNELREASLALGVSKWGTIRNIVIPSSISGMTSGVIISIGRAIGETAAVLFTAGYALFISESILEPTASLPNMIYRYYDRASTFPEIRDKLYAVALTLIIIVLLLNLVARVINYYSTRKLYN